jgi:hypothetical protein
MMKRLLWLSMFLAVGGPVLAQKSGGPWNVVEGGAVPDGKADCTAAFQKQLDQAGQAGGGVVEVPAGRFRIEGVLSIPANVTLQGIYRVPPTPTRDASGALGGSVLLAYAGRGSEDGKPFVRLAGNNAAIAGLVVTYPEWQQSAVPPVPYPPCVFSQDTENVGVRDCCLLNPYEGIKFVRAARHLVRNVTGYPIKRGIFVDECYDIGHIENVHFWPFGVAYEPNDPYCKWINTQGVAFELARTDWHYVHNTFCFGYGVGYKFSKSKQGSTNGNFLGLGADSCRRAVLVEQTQAPGLLISNGEFVGRWSSEDSVCVEIGPELEGTVSLVNCSFWGPIDRCVWMRGQSGQFTASACHFIDWDNGSVGSPAIQLDAGRAIIQACWFSQERLEVLVSSNVVSAILSGNQAVGGFRARNEAGKRTQIALNEENPLETSESARACYQIRIGKTGDERFLQHWHRREKSPLPMRWSWGDSRLVLPVNPGQAYTITLEMSVPAQAMTEEAGLYLDGNRLAPLPNSSKLVATIPATTKDSVELELRSKGWRPQETIPGSTDSRTLGVQLSKILMCSTNSNAAVLDVNTGRWQANPGNTQLPIPPPR